MAISFIQKTEQKDTGISKTSLANATPLNTTNGNLLVIVATFWDETGSISGITDTAGNTYTKVERKQNTETIYTTEIWYAKNITGNANNVTTIAFGGYTGLGVNYPMMGILEFSGANITSPLDDYSTNEEDGVSTFTTGDMTASTNDSVIIGVVNAGSNARNYTVGSGFTSIFTDVTLVYDFGEYKIISSSGDYDADGTISGTVNYSSVGAIFKGEDGNISISPSAQTLTLSLQSPTTIGTDKSLSITSAQSLTLSAQAPTIEGLYFPVNISSAQALTLAQASPTPTIVNGDILESEVIFLNNQNVLTAKINATITSGASNLFYLLSNDGGSTWENASLNTWHTFTSTGTQLKYKIAGNSAELSKVEVRYTV